MVESNRRLVTRMLVLCLVPWLLKACRYKAQRAYASLMWATESLGQVCSLLECKTRVWETAFFLSLLSCPLQPAFFPFFSNFLLKCESLLQDMSIEDPSVVFCWRKVEYGKGNIILGKESEWMSNSPHCSLIIKKTTRPLSCPSQHECNQALVLLGMHEGNRKPVCLSRYRLSRRERIQIWVMMAVLLPPLLVIQPLNHRAGTK